MFPPQELSALFFFFYLRNSSFQRSDTVCVGFQGHDYAAE